QTVMLLIEDDDGRLLLMRRPPTGVWAGMWSLPEAENEKAASRWVESHFREATSISAPAAFTHAFSHYRLQIAPQRWQAMMKPAVAEADERRWISRDDLAGIGLPQPVRKLIESLPSE